MGLTATAKGFVPAATVVVELFVPSITVVGAGRDIRGCIVRAVDHSNGVVVQISRIDRVCDRIYGNRPRAEIGRNGCGRIICPVNNGYAITEEVIDVDLIGYRIYGDRKRL